MYVYMCVCVCVELEDYKSKTLAELCIHKHQPDHVTLNTTMYLLTYAEMYF